MFFGRKEELDTLEKMYSSDDFQFAVIYGRRRVGKTSLVKEFCKDKKSIYFLSREASGEINLKNFSNDVCKITTKNKSNRLNFDNWESAFLDIYKISKNRRIILAIDEYPYLAKGFSPISSILQAHIDENFKKSKLFLILCGSSMSFMEKQVLGYKSPLYGRRTAQFKILPFNFFESTEFVPSFGQEDKLAIYGITGGIPEYLNKIDKTKTLTENITNLFFTSSGLFFEEPSNLLKQELREPSIYNGIIEAVASGASKLNEISAKAGHLENNKCEKYIRSLIELGIIKKEYPYSKNSSKKTIYVLKDQMFRFWYKFVFRDMSGISEGLGKEIFKNDVLPELNAFLGFTFEEVCKQYLIHLVKNKKFPFFVTNFGRWWGNNPKEKQEEEIDIIGTKKENILLSECKWRNEKTDLSVLKNLIRKSELFPEFTEKYYYLFSKSGFTRSVILESEKNKNIKLIKFQDMF